MNTVILDVAFPLTIGSIVTLCVLSLLLVITRIRRDRRELARLARRADIARSILRNDADRLRELTAAAVTRRDLRTDVADALREADAHLLRDVAPRVLVDVAVVDTHDAWATRRALGAELVAQLGNDDDLVHVARIMHEDGDRQARRLAARSLSRRGDEAAARHLVDGLVRRSLPADRLIEQLGYPFAVPTMMAALEREDAHVAYGDLLSALGLSGDVAALRPAAYFARVGNDHQRLRACRAMGRLKSRDAVPLLLTAMGDRAPVVRAMAARSLGELADARSVSALEGALGDADWWVRANAAEALRHLGSAGIEALERASQSSDRFARDRAQEALALQAALATTPPPVARAA